MSRREVSLAEALDWGRTREVESTSKVYDDEVVTFTDGSQIVLEHVPGHGGGCDTCGYGADEGSVHVYIVAAPRVGG